MLIMLCFSCRIDLDLGVTSLLQPDRLCTVAGPTTGPSISAQAPSGDHLLSHLLRLERAVAADNRKHTQRTATSPSRSKSQMSRIEAIKATAASLSNRIESEARKLVGEGVNYGTPTTMDVDTILPPRPSNLDGGCWAEASACATENNDMALRIQRILTSTSHSPFNSTSLQGSGNLHALRGQEENNGTHLSFTNPHMTSFDLVGPVFDSYSQEKRKLVNGLETEERMDKGRQRKQHDKEENRTDIHDSSAGSISEGPLLSDESFSEHEVSLPQPSKNRIPRTADRLEAVDHGPRQRKDYQRLLEFQREAEMCTALSSPFAQHDSNKAAWEELNKGSPLSVINIFTKNLHGHVKGEFKYEFPPPTENTVIDHD